MLIIFVAHMPGNFLALWIPARFGFSDAAEIFVFCSGMASAVAFGKVFAQRSWWLGTARVSLRVWQVYWAHIGTFFAIAALVAAIDHFGQYDKSYVASLNLLPFFKNTPENLLGLLSLSYVPNYFDILPMYIVVLVLMPLVVGLALVRLQWAVVLVLVMWLSATVGWIDLPAEPWSTREWFFNPFAWQLVFFTGFALMMGWIPAPKVEARWIALALAIVLLSVPLAHYRLVQVLPMVVEWRRDFSPLFAKTDFGILRYVHFLALAYLAWAAAGEGGRRLRPQGQSLLARGWRYVVQIISKVGQQSLAIFMYSMFIAQLGGYVLDLLKRDTATVWAVNLVALGSMVVVAYIVAWYKSQPWRARK